MTLKLVINNSQPIIETAETFELICDCGSLAFTVSQTKGDDYLMCNCSECDAQFNIRINGQPD